MPKDYIDRCLCGYFLTQEEIDSEQCPECDGSISSLSDRWEAWEERQIDRARSKKKQEVTAVE